ncbi:Putative adenosylhomocysteinase 3 [Tupaia chinensis]|uniref:Putative adenosylhomocysteinase 3 n=1 Tax=Tupaia chinensis TaxID=246437 RepID=L9JBU5_TUPCH|nr:Putative adenosylhomocysteinase 3 [Tupaia chinensis]
MKRGDPHHQHQRHRDGGEALVSPDGTVTEAPRTVKKSGTDAVPFICRFCNILASSLNGEGSSNVHFLSSEICPPCSVGGH